MEKIGETAEEVLYDLRKYSVLKYLGKLIEDYSYKQVKSPDELQAFIAEVDKITDIHRG